MFVKLSKYAGKASAKVANAAMNTAKSTPSYIGKVSQEFSSEWKKGYTEQQEKNRKG